MSRWLKELQASELWQDKPFAKGQAWIDMVLSAKQREDGWYFEYNYRKLAERWGWSTTKIKNFMSWLEQQGRIIKNTEEDITVRLVNTDAYSTAKHCQPRAEYKNNIGNQLAITKNTQMTIYYPHDEKLNKAFVNFVAMRQSLGIRTTSTDAEILMRKLAKMSTHGGIVDNDLAIVILEQSITNKWKDIYQLRNNNSHNARDIVQEWRNS